MAARWPKNKLITNEKISSGNIIIGLSSSGRSVYEQDYNSGIGSNGLTSARHDILSKHYKEDFPETYENSLSDDVVYIGKYNLNDSLTINESGKQYETNIGKLILSPTRTFAPVLKQILEEQFENIFGLIHCSGGGQTKCMKYMPDNLKVVKDNLFEPPVIFNIIQEASGADEREMYQVFNMGCRMEIYTNDKAADDIINIAESFGIEARIIGRTESYSKKELLIKTPVAEIVY